MKHLRFEGEEEIQRSHYTRTHWERASIETLVKVGNLQEPCVTLIDHGSKINLMSKEL